MTMLTLNCLVVRMKGTFGGTQAGILLIGDYDVMGTGLWESDMREVLVVWGNTLRSLLPMLETVEQAWKEDEGKQLPIPDT